MKLWVLFWHSTFIQTAWKEMNSKVCTWNIDKMFMYALMRVPRCACVCVRAWIVISILHFFCLHSLIATIFVQLYQKYKYLVVKLNITCSKLNRSFVRVTRTFFFWWMQCFICMRKNFMRCKLDFCHSNVFNVKVYEIVITKI